MTEQGADHRVVPSERRPLGERMRPGRHALAGHRSTDHDVLHRECRANAAVSNIPRLARPPPTTAGLPGRANAATAPSASRSP